MRLNGLNELLCQPPAIAGGLLSDHNERFALFGLRCQTAHDQLFIGPVECIDCGAYVPVCPVSAIFALDNFPEKWQSYIEKNSNYVEGVKFKPDKYRPAQTVNHQTMTLHLLMSKVRSVHDGRRV